MFSIIILSHNRLNLLEKSIFSITNQSINPSKYEIIVVDSSINRSKFDELSAKIKKKFKKVNFTFITRSKNLDQTYKRNIAVNLAKFEWLIFIDDDVFLNIKSLEKVSIFLSSRYDKFSIISGRLLPLLESSKYRYQFLKKKNFIIKFSYYIKDFSILDLGLKNFIQVKKYLFASLFMIKKNIYIKSGGLGPDGYKGNKILLNGSGENNILNYAKENDLQVLYCPSLSGKHYISNYRFTEEYVKSRNFYYGISESFTYVRDSTFITILINFLKYFFLNILIMCKINESSEVNHIRIKGRILHLYFSIVNKEFRSYCKYNDWYNNKHLNFVKKFSFNTKYNYLFWSNKK